MGTASIGGATRRLGSSGEFVVIAVAKTNWMARIGHFRKER